MIHDEYKWRNKVIVTRIMNEDEAEHLKQYIGLEGELSSFICDGGDYRYKVVFKDNDQHYFRGSELRVTQVADDIDTSIIDKMLEEDKDWEILNRFYEQQSR